LIAGQILATAYMKKEEYPYNMRYYQDIEFRVMSYC